MIPTSVHGLLDYIVGALLALLGVAYFGLQTAPGAPLALCGFGAIMYSLLTAYERGIYPVIPMKAHLALDALNGAFLTASPWLLGFADRTWAGHVALGLMELAVVALSSRTPSRMSARAA